MTKAIIRVIDLVKTYSEVTAVKGMCSISVLTET